MNRGIVVVGAIIIIVAFITWVIYEIKKVEKQWNKNPKETEKYWAS